MRLFGSNPLCSIYLRNPITDPSQNEKLAWLNSRYFLGFPVDGTQCFNGTGSQSCASFFRLS
jgi:hypothetical protein